MQPLIPPSDPSTRPEIQQAKRRYGFTYGLVVGLGFAVATWGVDGYLLSQAHALFPWLKLIVGAILCSSIGGVTGWLAMRLERGLFSMLLWLAAAGLFALLTVALPLQIAPRLTTLLAPSLNGLLKYTFYDSLTARFGVAYVWLAIFVGIVGLLELPMGEPAVFSTSFFGKIAPFLFCLVVVGISGFIVDNLNNEPLRSAIITMDKTIQFVVDNPSNSADAETARKMHAASLRDISSLVTPSRQLIIGDYDQYLEQIHVLVHFGDQWVSCLTVYNQPSNCAEISP